MAQLQLKDEEFTVEMRDASPSNFLIKIESFSSLAKNGISTYECRQFEAEGYKWKMTISPSGEDVGVWLSVVETSCFPQDWDVNALFSFFLYNHITNNYTCFRGTTRRFNAVFPKWGFSKLISNKNLIDPSKGYLVKDSCVFGAEVFVIKSQRINECLSLLTDTTPFKREWKLSHFSKMENIWYSEEFDAGDHKWKVKVYPKGDSTARATNQYVSIYLCCVDSNSFGLHRKLKAAVTLRIKSKIHETHHCRNYNHWFTSSSQIWGYGEFIRIADLSSREFLDDDCCFIEVEVSVQALALDAPKT